MIPMLVACLVVFFIFRLIMKSNAKAAIGVVVLFLVMLFLNWYGGRARAGDVAQDDNPIFFSINFNGDSIGIACGSDEVLLLPFPLEDEVMAVSRKNSIQFRTQSRADTGLVQKTTTTTIRSGKQTTENLYSYQSYVEKTLSYEHGFEIREVDNGFLVGHQEDGIVICSANFLFKEKLVFIVERSQGDMRSAIDSVKEQMDLIKNYNQIILGK